jgi:hypothetical protein
LQKHVDGGQCSGDHSKVHAELTTADAPTLFAPSAAFEPIATADAPTVLAPSTAIALA